MIFNLRKRKNDRVGFFLGFVPIQSSNTVSLTSAPK